MTPGTIDFYSRSLDCVHCGLCLQSCPTYGVFGLETESPRGRIYLMRALAEGRIEQPGDIRVHLDRCLGCRACESACPSGVKYGHMLELARSEFQTRWPQTGLRARLRGFLLERVIGNQARLRFAFAAGGLAERLGLRWLARRIGLLPKAVDRLLPRVPPRRDRRPLRGVFEPEGTARGRVHLFTGCVMEQAFGGINRATLQLLLEQGFEVTVPEQACCGALLSHDGRAEAAAELARRNLAAFRDADVIINNSAGCGAALKEYGEHLGDEQSADFSRKCRDVCEFLNDAGLRTTPAPFPRRVVYDAPCHLAHGQGVRDAPLELLRQVPEITLVPHASADDCCGSAGIYNLLQPEIAARIGGDKARALAASGAEVVATGNPGCMMQISAHLREAGADMRVVHPVELLLARPRCP